MRIQRLNKDTKQNLLEDLLKRSPNSYGQYEESVQAILNEVKTKKDEASIVSEKEKVESNKSLNVDKDIDDGKTKEFKEKIVEEEPEITEVVEDNADEIL